MICEFVRNFPIFEELNQAASRVSEKVASSRSIGDDNKANAAAVFLVLFSHLLSRKRVLHIYIYNVIFNYLSPPTTNYTTTRTHYDEPLRIFDRIYRTKRTA